MAKQVSKVPEHELFIPVDQTDEDLLIAFPQLASHPEFALFTGNDRDKWIRFAFFYSDKGSGLMKIKDIGDRLSAAFKEAKLPYEYPIPLYGQAMIYRVVRMRNDLKFAFWLRGNEMLWQDIEKIGEPINTSPDSDTEDALSQNKKKAKVGEEKEGDIQRAYKLRGELFDALPERIEKLQSIEKELFSSDVELKKMVTEVVSRKNQGTVEKYIAY